MANDLEICVILIGKRHLSSICHLLLVLLENRLINLDFRGSKSWGGNEVEGLVTDELPGEPEEWLLEVVIGLGRDIVVLKILLAMEGDGLGLDFSLFHIDLVSAEDNRNAFAHADQITMPVWDVLVGDTRGNVEHDDTALAVDVVSISQATELLLTSGIPDVKLDLAQVRGEAKWVNFDTESGDVFLLEFTSEMALDEGGLSGTAITDKDELEGRYSCVRHDLCVVGC